MIIGFLGKGGSGKSTLSTQMVFFLNKKVRNILAIDADHNMDLSYNLLGNTPFSAEYFSQSLDMLARVVGLSSEEKYSKAFLSDVDIRFSLTPLSKEIRTYSEVTKDGIQLMVAGPQTDTVLYGKACSHILTTPLKILLPLLELKEDEAVVVDEKAGADGVTTGIVTGIDVGIIVCEPSFHSLKTAKQIAELMDFYETPYMFVANKIISSEDKDFIVSELGKNPVAFLMDSVGIKRNPSVLVDEWLDELEVVFEVAKKLNQNNRLERTIKKFKRNDEFLVSGRL